MKLYDVVKLTENCYDTCDTIFDIVVTVDFIEEDKNNDNYEKFCIEIMKKAEAEKVNGDIIVVKWTELIKNNMEKFKEFSRENWNTSYEDDEDEFIYQWIKEIHYYMAGYVADDFYSKLVELINDLKA